MPEAALTLAASWPAFPDAEVASGTILRLLPPVTRVRLQLARREIPMSGGVVVDGTELPTTPGRCAGDDPAALWLAPDGWLLVSVRRDGDALVRLAREACGTRIAAAVDVSDSLVAFELAGPGVRALLARGTGLALTDEALAVGRCTRLRFAQLAVILRPFGRDRVELTLDRTPAAWLRDWFVDAGAALRG
jgi:heterotetrameric sarcosine oxidase gamma subunit